MPGKDKSRFTCVDNQTGEQLGVFEGTYRDMTQNMCPGSDPPNSVLWAACATMNNTTDTTGRLCDLDPM